MEGANTLAYYNMAKNTVVKGFTVQAPDLSPAAEAPVL